MSKVKTAAGVLSLLSCCAWMGCSSTRTFRRPLPEAAAVEPAEAAKAPPAHGQLQAPLITRAALEAMLPAEAVIEWRRTPRSALLDEGASALRFEGAELRFIGD